MAANGDMADTDEVTEFEIEIANSIAASAAPPLTSPSTENTGCGSKIDPSRLYLLASVLILSNSCPSFRMMVSRDKRL